MHPKIDQSTQQGWIWFSCHPVSSTSSSASSMVPSCCVKPWLLRLTDRASSQKQASALLVHRHHQSLAYRAVILKCELRAYRREKTWWWSVATFSINDENLATLLVGKSLRVVCITTNHRSQTVKLSMKVTILIATLPRILTICLLFCHYIET